MTRSGSTKGNWATTWRGTALLLGLLAAAVTALLVARPVEGIRSRRSRGGTTGR